MAPQHNIPMQVKYIAMLRTVVMLLVGHNFSRLPESMSSRVRIMDLSWEQKGPTDGVTCNLDFTQNPDRKTFQSQKFSLQMLEISGKSLVLTMDLSLELIELQACSRYLSLLNNHNNVLNLFQIVTCIELLIAVLSSYFQ